MRAEHADTPLRMLYRGSAVAGAFGLLLGAAVKPDLREGAGPEGPQMLAGVSDARLAPEAYAAEPVFRPGPVPDYVIGTDWLRPPVYDAPPAYEPPAYADYAAEAYAAPPTVEYARPAPYELADLEDRLPPRIPSLHGDVLGGPAEPARPRVTTVAPIEPAA